MLTAWADEERKIERAAATQVIERILLPLNDEGFGVLRISLRYGAQSLARPGS
jgi:hypothetical protein